MLERSAFDLSSRFSWFFRISFFTKFHWLHWILRIYFLLAPTLNVQICFFNSSSRSIKYYNSYAEKGAPKWIQWYRYAKHKHLFTLSAIFYSSRNILSWNFKRIYFLPSLRFRELRLKTIRGCIDPILKRKKMQQLFFLLLLVVLLSRTLTIKTDSK